MFGGEHNCIKISEAVPTYIHNIWWSLWERSFLFVLSLFLIVKTLWSFPFSLQRQRTPKFVAMHSQNSWTCRYPGLRATTHNLECWEWMQVLFTLIIGVWSKHRVFICLTFIHYWKSSIQFKFDKWYKTHMHLQPTNICIVSHLTVSHNSQILVRLGHNVWSPSLLHPLAAVSQIAYYTCRIIKDFILKYYIVFYTVTPLNHCQTLEPHSSCKSTVLHAQTGQK